MKKIIATILILFSLNSYAQDSVKVTISIQDRDASLIGSFAFNDNRFENIFDSIKVKYRSPNTPPATVTTTVSVTGYTVDWIMIMRELKNNTAAIKGGTTGRVETLLRGASQTFLTAAIDALDTQDATNFIAVRLFGRSKLRRQ